jgi:hypothetical protein
MPTKIGVDSIKNTAANIRFAAMLADGTAMGICKTIS